MKENILKNEITLDNKTVKSVWCVERTHSVKEENVSSIEPYSWWLSPRRREMCEQSGQCERGSLSVTDFLVQPGPDKQITPVTKHDMPSTT